MNNTYCKTIYIKILESDGNYFPQFVNQFPFKGGIYNLDQQYSIALLPCTSPFFIAMIQNRITVRLKTPGEYNKVL